jgi:hypothetical protein
MPRLNTAARQGPHYLLGGSIVHGDGGTDQVLRSGNAEKTERVQAKSKRFC